MNETAMYVFNIVGVAFILFAIGYVLYIKVADYLQVRRILKKRSQLLAKRNYYEKVRERNIEKNKMNAIKHEIQKQILTKEILNRNNTNNY